MTLESRFLTSSLEDVVATIEAYRPVEILETRR
jgi:hypothetical protein